MKGFALIWCVLLGTFPIILTKRFGPVDDDVLKLDLVFPGNSQNLHSLELLKRPEGNSILHPNIRVTSVEHDKSSGRLVLDHWKPSEQERRSAEDLYLDQKNLAALKVLRKDDGTRRMHGVINGMHFDHDGQSYRLTPAPKFENDFIDLGIKTGLNKSISADEPVDAVVEIAIVCDKEWGDLFQHDRQKILEHWSIFYWDMNMRYKTLKSVNMSLIITSITVFSSLEAQSFIEESRDAEGRVSYYTLLPKFGDWIGSQAALNAIPMYDAALLAIDSKSSHIGLGGLAYVGLACNPSRSVGIHSANKRFNTVQPAAHELAHVLGGKHRAEVEWCDDQRSGLIMSEPENEEEIKLGYFFGPCSDRMLSEFVRTERASCLRRIDEQGKPPVSPGFAEYEVPNMDQQCKLLFNNDSAVIGDGFEGICYYPLCWSPDGQYAYEFLPVDNTPCLGGGRCFRGRCLKRNGLIKNVGSGHCLLGQDRFSSNDAAVVVPCPQYPTPMDKFQRFYEDGKTKLALAYSNLNATESTDKCLWTGDGEGHDLAFGLCSTEGDPKFRWQIRPDGNSNTEAFLCNANGACAIQEGMNVKSYTNYDSSSPFSRWTFL